MNHDGDFHLERSGIDTNDPELIQKYLDEAYGSHISIARADDSDDARSCSHSRIDVGRYAVEEIRHNGDIRLSADHVPSVVALSPLDGRVESEYGELSALAGRGEWVLASTGTDGMHVRLANAHLRSVVLDRSLVAEVAAADVAEHSVVRFTGLTPTSAAMSRTLDTAERFVNHLVSTPDIADAPALLGAAGRMLAAAVLAAFPNELPEIAPDDPADAHQGVLGQALDFIEVNAARDIGVADIAAAVYLTPRTVQYMFRRHLDTTPTAYVREVRLRRAHEELLASNRGVTTVAATAARWGFAHTGRFAVLYRRAYGDSPHETLRR